MCFVVVVVVVVVVVFVVVVVVVVVDFDGEGVFVLTLLIFVDGRASIALIQSEKYPDVPALYKARPSLLFGLCEILLCVAGTWRLAWIYNYAIRIFSSWPEE